MNDYHLVVSKETVRQALRLIDPEGVERRLRHRLNEDNRRQRDPIIFGTLTGMINSHHSASVSMAASMVILDV